MRKKIFLFTITVIAALNLLTGCGANDQYQALIDNKDNIFIISLDETIKDSLNGVGEISSDIKATSDKQYKFIFLSEVEAEKIVSYADTETLKNKIIEGYNLIYYQQDKTKLNSFMSKFYLSQNLETGESNVLTGCVLHKDINYVLKSSFVNGYPIFYNTDVNAIHFVKAQIQEVICQNLIYSEKDTFLGVYISEAQFKDSDFKEVRKFDLNTEYDKFDTFTNTPNKKFKYEYSATESKIIYSVEYEIPFTYFIPYIIVKDFSGQIHARTIRGNNAVYTYPAGFTLSQEREVFTGSPGFDKQEYLKVTFYFI